MKDLFDIKYLVNNYWYAATDLEAVDGTGTGQ